MQRIFSADAELLLKERFLRTVSGRQETPREMICRVASVVASAEAPSERKLWAERFEEAMLSLRFLPNSPTLANAAQGGGQLSACYVLPLEDNMSSIFETLKHQALVHQSGGGTGFDFTPLRPEGSLVKSSGGFASGPVSFMKLFSAATETVKQGGMRRGANIAYSLTDGGAVGLGDRLDSATRNRSSTDAMRASMAVLSCEHPDILKFIRSKIEGEDLKNFNLSVSYTDEFLFRAASGDAFAANVLKEAAYAAWRCGEPGALFIDAINRSNPTPWMGRLKATNPCVSGDTYVLTDKGEVPISLLVGRRTRVWNGEEFSTVVPSVTGENAPVLRVEFSDGRILRCTPYHSFFTFGTELDEAHPVIYKVYAASLKPGDAVKIFRKPGKHSGFARVVSVVPDGTERYVYCFTESRRNAGTFNGVLTGNCGETPLYPYEACNLGSVDVSRFVRDGEVSWNALDETVRTGVRFLDDVVSLGRYPLPEIREMVAKTRKTGLGVMGFADALFRLRVPYDSDEARYFADSLMGRIQNVAREYSEELGREKGCCEGVNVPRLKSRACRSNYNCKNVLQATN